MFRTTLIGIYYSRVQTLVIQTMNLGLNILSTLINLLKILLENIRYYYLIAIGVTLL